jgi:hypothetical protein
MIQTKRTAIAFVGAAAMLAASWLFVGISARATVPRPAPQPSFGADALLADAEGAAPFAIEIPEYLPRGLTLLNVIYGGADPDADNPDGFFIDIYWVAEDGRYLHIWQTNAPEASKNPTLDRAPQFRELAMRLGRVA